MENLGVVIAAMIGGMLCGAVLIAALVFGYFRMVSPKHPQPPDYRDAVTFGQRPQSLSDAIAAPVLPAIPESFRTLEHANLPPGLPWLDGIGGMVAGQRIILQREETIMGRSRVCDIQFQDPKVSRQHAMLRLYRGRYFLQDMQSSRGTLVNNQRIQTHLLQDGDQIRLGDTVLVFRLPQPADEPAPPAEQ